MTPVPAPAPLTDGGIVLPVEAARGPIEVRGLVALDLRCSDCEGVGTVANPVAEAWWERFEAYHAKRQAAGIGGRAVDMVDWEVVEGNCPGQLEEACGECEGRGWVLTRAGSAILALVRRHLSPG